MGRDPRQDPDKARVVTAQESALLRLHEGEKVRVVGDKM